MARMTARFSRGRCAGCRERVHAGDIIDFDRATRQMLCATCAPAPDPTAAPAHAALPRPPAVVRVTLDGGQVAFQKAGGRLSDEAFAAYRAALAGGRFAAGVNTLPLDRAGDAIVALIAAHFALDVAPDAKARVSARAGETIDWAAIDAAAADARGKAEERARAAAAEHARRRAEAQAAAKARKVRRSVRATAARRLNEPQADQNAPVRGPATALERWAIEGLRQLAALDPDRAREKNEVGYNASDGRLGHHLASFGELTDQEWRLAVQIARHYPGQIGAPPDGRANESGAPRKSKARGAARASTVAAPPIPAGPPSAPAPPLATSVASAAESPPVQASPPASHSPAPGAASLQVAETILEQLGGRQFVAMTGARNLTGYPDALAFKLPANFAKDGINYVRITLDPSDTYVLRFAKLGLPPERKLKQVAEVESVYSDNLAEVFTRYTGLDTSLATGASSAPSSAAPSEPKANVAEAGPPPSSAAPAAPPPSSHRPPVSSAPPLPSAAPVAPALPSRLVEAFATPRTYPAVRDALLAQDASLSREAVYAAFASLCDAHTLIACGVGARADTLYRAARGPAAVAEVDQKIREQVGAQNPNAVVITWQGGLVTNVEVDGIPIAESDWKRLRARGLVDMIWVPGSWHPEGASQVFIKGRWISSPHAAERFRVASGMASAHPSEASQRPASAQSAATRPTRAPLAEPPSPVAPPATPTASGAPEPPVWLVLHREPPRADRRDRSLSSLARRLFHVLQRQAERHAGARWETPFLLDLAAAAAELGERRGDLIHSLAILNMARLATLAEPPTSRQMPSSRPAADVPEAAPISLPGSTRTVEPSPRGSQHAGIPADAAPNPPFTAVATSAGPETQATLARYGDLAVHRALNARKSTAGSLAVTHEGTGLSVATFVPRRPGQGLDPAALEEARGT